MDREEIGVSEEHRKKAFRRNPMLEKLLDELNGALVPAERIILDRLSGEATAQPLIFVFGPLRSGTTLFMQWLASTGAVAYPSNLLSRFYRAPLTGAMIQLMLTDPQYRFRDELAGIEVQIPFDSENGKTRGILAPNEFWYFWRRFLPFESIDWLPDEELFARVDTALLRAELNGLACLFGKPFALKSMILNYNIPFLSQLFDRALFVQLRRNSVDNVASVLDARVNQLGSEERWYSFKIPEYEELRKMDPVFQCAGQVHYINQAVLKGMELVDEKRKLLVDYEDFCRNPERVYRQILTGLDYSLDNHPYIGPSSFRRSRRVHSEKVAQIAEALSYFGGERSIG